MTIFPEDLCVILVAGCHGGSEEPLAEALEFTQVTQETFRMASALSSVCSEPCYLSSLPEGQCLTWQVLYLNLIYHKSHCGGETVELSRPGISDYLLSSGQKTAS